MDKPCHIQEFAALTGVSVRALHHYDRLGLLRPRRSASGYRLYSRPELERLEQIVALKFIGIPLKQIKTVLHHSTGLPDALRMQRTVLVEKRRRLDLAIQAIAKAEQSPDTAILKSIIEVIEMQNKSDWMNKYYSPEARAAIQQRQATWTPELQAQTQQAWLDLFRDVESALTEDPASEKAQDLGARWKELLGAFTGGNPEIAKGLRNLHAERSNWSAPLQDQMAPYNNPAVWEFMGRVLKCRASVDKS